MNLLFINPPIRLDDKPRHIPHGLAILANIVKKKFKFPIDFLDINANRYDDLVVEKILKSKQFDVVLLGGLVPTYKYIVKLSATIRKINPDSLIICGGYVAMSVPELLLKNSEVDIVCLGEGEITIVELLKRLKKRDFSDVLGIAYKRNGKIIFNKPQPLISNLDTESDLPAYEFLPMQIYLSNPVTGIGRDIDFISSRGCPYRCSFCYQPFKTPRLHSVDFIIRAIKFLKEKYDIDFISFQDDEFMLDKKRVIDFCKAMKKNFPDILWSCTGRVNIVANDEDLVKLMRECGCVDIGFGFESGSQEMLDRMKKNITVEQMEKTIKILRKYGLPIDVSFIIGLPGETKKTLNETLNFCLRNNITLDTFMFATPYPKTEIFDFALRTGRINKNDLHNFVCSLGDARQFLVNLTDDLSDEELIKIRQEMIEITRLNYEKFLSKEERTEKLKALYGQLLDKYKFDNQDLKHRLEHGTLDIF